MVRYQLEDADYQRLLRLRANLMLEKLAALYLDELSRLAKGLLPIWQSYLGRQSPGRPGLPRGARLNPCPAPEGPVACAWGPLVSG